MTFPRPRNFPYDEVFFSDGNFALMLGNYKGRNTKSLGMRWTASESNLGFPNIFGRSIWMVVPDQLGVYILNGVLTDEQPSNAKTYRKNEIQNALESLRSQVLAE